LFCGQEEGNAPAAIRRRLPPPKSRSKRTQDLLPAHVCGASPELIPRIHFSLNTSKQVKYSGGEEMEIERMVLAFAGFFILVSLVLAQIHSSYWLLFTAFVGLNLFQSAFTGFCPLAKILKVLGIKPLTNMFRY
jgi:hypothetical protein